MTSFIHNPRRINEMIVGDGLPPRHYAALLTDAWVPGHVPPGGWGEVRAYEVVAASYVRQETIMKVTTHPDGNTAVIAEDIFFGQAADFTAKWLVLAAGDPAAPTDADQILGYLDLVPGGLLAAQGEPVEVNFDPYGLIIVSHRPKVPVVAYQLDQITLQVSTGEVRTVSSGHTLTVSLPG